MKPKNCIHCKNQSICKGYDVAHELIVFLNRQPRQAIYKTAIMETVASECTKFEHIED